MSNLLELYNGDSQFIFPKVISNLEGSKIIIVSDPPFNIGYKYNTYKDTMNEDNYYEMLELFFWYLSECCNTLS